MLVLNVFTIFCCIVAINIKPYNSNLILPRSQDQNTSGDHHLEVDAQKGTVSEQVAAKCTIERRHYIEVHSKTQVGVYYNADNVLYAPAFAQDTLPESCKELLNKGYKKSGIYKIKPSMATKPFMVLCDMEIRGGGWTHIQKRFDGSQDFFLEYRDYKFGFGDLDGEFWMGLQKIQLLTAKYSSSLLVEIVDRENTAVYAHYNNFKVGTETQGFPLSTVGEYSGDAGDSLKRHEGQKFSTKDFDRDSSTNANCAELYMGGWWYDSCFASSPNGKFLNVELGSAYKWKGVHWETYKGSTYCNAKIRMLVKPNH